MSSGELRNLADRLLSILFPPRCVLCGRVVDYGGLWCGKCPYPLSPGQGERDALAPFAYRDAARGMVIRLKDESHKPTAAFLAHAMAELCHREIPSLNNGEWLLAPVPIHPEGFRKRGYNHAELLARALGEELGLPVETGLLQRLDSTIPQHTLGPEERFRNAAESYRIGEKADRCPGKQILLVDDVITTGATIAACTRCLLELGASRVIAVAATATTPEID